MKTFRSGIRRGFTLIELSLAMGIGMAIATLVLMLVNQQLAFLNLLKAQDFLTEEAPMISLYVGKMAGKADRFRLHASVADALAGRDPRLTESPVMLMNFRQPDGTMRASILSFETQNGREALNYYMVPVSASPTLGAPHWSITKKADDILFFVEEGILRMQITGPAQERVTYSGTMQQ